MNTNDQLKAELTAVVVGKPKITMLSAGSVLELTVRTNHDFVEKHTGETRNQDNYFVVKTYNNIEEMEKVLLPGVTATFEGWWRGRKWDNVQKEQTYVFNHLQAYTISINKDDKNSTQDNKEPRGDSAADTVTASDIPF